MLILIVASCFCALVLPGGPAPLIDRYRAIHRRPSTGYAQGENAVIVDRFIFGPWRMDRAVSEQDKECFRESYASNRSDGLYTELRRLHGDDAGVDGWFLAGWEIEETCEIMPIGHRPCSLRKARPLLHVSRRSEAPVLLAGAWQTGKTAAEEQLDTMRRSFRLNPSIVLAGRAPMSLPGAVGPSSSSSSNRSSPY